MLPIITFSVNDADKWWSTHAEGFIRYFSSYGVSNIRDFRKYNTSNWCCYQFNIVEKAVFFAWLSAPETRLWFAGKGVNTLSQEHVVDFWYPSEFQSEYEVWETL